MELIYTSLEPIKGVYDCDCKVINQTMKTIYKEQLRKEGGRKTDLTYYILELDNSYNRLETNQDNSQKAIWVNLTDYHFLELSEQETRFLSFEDKADLLDYVVDRWNAKGYLFIDTRNKLIDYKEVNHMARLASSNLHDKVLQAVEDQQNYEEDCHDYYDSIKHGCLN